MLVFTRKSRESIIIGGPADLERVLKITVLEIRTGSVKLGFDVSKDIPVNRWEVWQRIRENTAPACVPRGQDEETG